MDKSIHDLISRMTLEERVGFMLISTTRLDGDFSFHSSAQKTEITSGFNEEDLIQLNNMFTRKLLSRPLISALGSTKGVNERHLRHFRGYDMAKPNLSDVPGHMEKDGYALFKFGHGLSY